MTEDVTEILARAAATTEPAERLDALSALDPHSRGTPADLNRAGVLCHQVNQLVAAKRFFSQAVEHQPDLVAAWVNLGACHNELGSQDEAIRCYRTALAIDGGNPDIWANLGKAHNDDGEFEMAVYCLREAESLLGPEASARKRANILLGQARAYHQGGRDRLAGDILRWVIALEPNNPQAHHSLASVHFHLEDFSAALEAFEWRLRLPAMDTFKGQLPGIFSRPACADGRAENRTLLLYTEQGFGDSIQFARFINLIRPHVGRLVMWCRPGLAELFRHNLDVDDISGDRDQLPRFDAHFPLLSIPRFFDPRLQSLSGFQPYLAAPGRTRIDLPQAAGLRIGLVWGADRAGYDYRNKTVPLADLQPLLDIAGTRWFSLQVGEESGDIQRLGLGHQLLDLAPHLQDFSATADAIQQLDLVVTTDTAVAHLAGAMGKPVWVMLKKQPDWRWDSGCERSLWYPSARLFRQHSYGDWGLVIKRIGQRLQTAASNGKPHDF